MKTIGSIVVVGAVVALGLMAWATVGMSGKLNAIERHLHETASLQRARDSTAVFIASWKPGPQDRFCAAGQETGATCEALSFRHHRDRGEHSDLWTFFDAVASVAKSPLPRDERRRFDRLQIDLAMALNEFGALDASLDRSGVPYALLANNHHLAAMALMAACQDLAGRIACSQGIPSRLSVAMGQMASFLVQEGRRSAPYAMNIRSEAMGRLIESGLIPLVLPQDPDGLIATAGSGG